MLSSVAVKRKRSIAPASRYGMGLMCSSAVFLPCFLALIAVFPVADDAWLLLLLKEHGSTVLTSEMANRPLFGWILRESFGSPEKYFVIGLIANTVTWIVMGLETQWLMVSLFPEWHAYGPLVAAITVAPIFSTVQLTTLPLIVPVNIGVTLCLAALILAAHSQETKRSQVISWVGAGSLVCCAWVLSEYAAASTIIIILVLLYFWRVSASLEERHNLLRAMLSVLVGALIGAVVFKLTAGARAGYTTSDIVTVAFTQIKGMPALVMDTYWRLLIGAFSLAAAKVRITSSEGSYLAAMAYGSFIATLLLWACRKKRAEASDGPPPQSYRIRGLLVLLIMGAGMLPVIFRSPSLAFVGRDSHLEEFASRLYLTAVPAAAIAFVFLIATLVRGRFSWIVIAVSGFVIGDVTFLQEWTTFRNNQKEALLGPAIEPLAHDASGLVVVVLNDYLGRDYEVTYKASQSWPPSESQRVWFLWEGQLTNRFGHPVNRESACGEGSALHIDVSGVHRDGLVRRMVYVEVLDNREMIVEPYCLPAANQ